MRRNRPGADSRQSPTFRAIFRYGFTCVCMYCVSEKYVYLQRPLGIESRARGDIRRRAPGERRARMVTSITF